MELIEKGKGKCIRGDIEDGLTDLRSALEKTIIQVVKKNKLKSKSNSKIQQNLKILNDEKLISKEIYSNLHKLLDSWLHHYLSNESVHGREKCTLRDSQFLFSLGEECIEYLMDKCIYRI